MISIDLLRLRDVTARRNKTALSKRESENCVRELEEKILKINQEPKAGWGEHMCRQKSLSPGSAGTCEELLRPRSAAELKVLRTNRGFVTITAGRCVPT